MAVIDPKKLPPFILLTTGGAGQSVALESFESLGYITVSGIDPTELLPTFRGLAQHPARPFVLALRFTPETSPDNLLHDVQLLKAEYSAMRIFALDAPEPILVQRFVESGKKHSFESDTHPGLQAGIRAEKAKFGPFKETVKDYSVDTSTTTPVELHHKIARVLGYPVNNNDFTVYITTFGFKYGIPPDAELMFDMRFMTNPFYDESLRPMTGRDKPVRDFIFNLPQAREFFERWSVLMAYILPYYRSEGKTRLTIAIGCTGGKHRSVCMGEALGEHLQQHLPDFKVVLTHRENQRWGAPALPVAEAQACEPFLATPAKDTPAT